MDIVDYSHWQAGVDANKLKGAGIMGGIVKAGQISLPSKTPYYDDRHDENIVRLKEAGLICGDYYYWLPKAGASLQARHYLEIRQRNIPDFPPILDVEDPQGLIKAEMSMQLKATIQYIEDKIGISPIIYTRGGLWVNSVGDPAWGANYKFWLAQYNNTLTRFSPTIKPNIIMWQYTDKLKIPGCPTMDGNYWMKSMVELQELIGKPTPPSGILDIRIKKGIYPLSKANREWLDRH